MPPVCEAPLAAELPVSEDDLTSLRTFLDQLAHQESDFPLETAIPAENFAVSSYRLSLAALLGDPESSALEGPVADLARLPLLMELTGESVVVGTCEVAAMSAGTMKQTAPKGDR